MREKVWQFVSVFGVAALCGCTPIKSFVGTNSLMPESRAIKQQMDHLEPPPSLKQALADPDPVLNPVLMK